MAGRTGHAFFRLLNLASQRVALDSVSASRDYRKPDSKEGIMDFTQAVNSGFKNYVGFEGRASRSEYWYWTLFSVIATIVAGTMDSFVGLGLAFR